MANRIQIRRDTAANWLAINPTLADGEPGLETDTGKIKYGNGGSVWSSLPYSGGAPNELVNGDHTVVLDSSGNITLSTLAGRPTVFYWNQFGIQNSSTNKQFVFQASGDLNIDGYINGSGATGLWSETSVALTWANSNPTVAPNLHVNTNATVSTTGFVIDNYVLDANSNPSNRTWTFGADGTLNLPASSNGQAIIQSPESIEINSNNSVWVYGADASLTVPSNGVITSVGGYTGTAVAIENVSLGTTTQIQANGHGLSEGDKITITGITSTTQLNNNVYYVHIVDANNITLFTDPALTQSVNSAAFYPYTYMSARTVANASVTYSTDTPYFTEYNVTQTWSNNTAGYGAYFTMQMPIFDGWQYSTTGWAISGPGGYFEHLAAPLANTAPGILQVYVVNAPSNPNATFTLQGGYGLPLGGSMIFNGSTSRLQVQNSLDFAPASTTAWTVEFWAKYTTTLQGGATLFSIGPAGNPMLALRVSSGGYMEIVFNGNGWSTGTFANAAYQPFGPNQWNHVAIVNNGSGTLAVFYSGQRLALETPVNLNYSSSNNFVIGASYADGGSNINIETNSGFAGLITDFRFVNGTAVYDPTASTLTLPTAPIGATPTTTELYIPASDPSHYAMDTTDTQSNTGGGDVLKEFASADLTLEVGAVAQEDPGHVVLKSGANQLRWGGANGALTFPDNTAQHTAYQRASTAWYQPPNVTVTLDNVIARIYNDGYVMQISTVTDANPSNGTGFAWSGTLNGTYFSQGGTNWVHSGSWLDLHVSAGLASDFDTGLVHVFDLSAGKIYRVSFFNVSGDQFSITIERIL